MELSKKAEEGAGAVDELLQQGGFDKVSYRDVPQPVVVVPPKEFEDFDSRKLVFNKIMEAVKDPNLNIIGVYGMPGVGKTTLVKEVIRQVKEDKLFDWVVMAVVTHTPDVRKIQDQIADMLGLKFEEQSTSGRASRLCQRLKKEKKILVVLDDIWAKLDLMEVGIPLGDENQRCTIMLTSRDLNVLLKDMDAKKSFPIGGLEHEEAWEFFKKIAGDGVESSGLLPIATEVAKKCGGLPIAISTLATSLRNEPPFVWEDAFTKEAIVEQLQRSTRIYIFNYRCLLMYAMGLGLFRGVSTVEETRNRLLTVVSHLKASCLLLDGYNNLRLDMHDLISDVATSIAANHVFVLRREDVLNDWPDDKTMKECDKISLFFPSMNKLPDQLKCPKFTFLDMAKDLQHLQSLNIDSSGVQESVPKNVEGLWQKCDWEDLWNLKATPKIKLFIRDACCNAIASTENLGKRHIIENSSCPRCEEGKETIEHILFFCPPAQATWRASTFNHTPSPKDFQSLSDWWLKIKQLLENSGANTDMSLIAWTCWGIWKAHNEWMLEGRDEDPVNTWNNALKGYHNFMENMLPPKHQPLN
ncbi:putative disease resistance protein [Gossypium australe]|uniref:Putative disease resistance protein n=1 Tax=Gossypium australe TaxID=47621 RepID=A0A5B6VRQ6_9ROSI|nr:putative disease resistance protein [Gossypium australe]